nr:uncharacterized protein LOC118879088 isoform X2 [Drosophila suzukii]XP_036677965.1 uncharacterized protein LOC118879089 isoform X2 [Drosophila suzukii]
MLVQIKMDAHSKLLPIFVRLYPQETILRQGKSAEYLKFWRLTKESQWEGTSQVEPCSLHGHPGGCVLAKKNHQHNLLRTLHWGVTGLHLHQLLGSLSGDGEHAGF